MVDVYESAIDPIDRYAAVFERDDFTAFFYLLDLEQDDGCQIIEAFDANRLTKSSARTPVEVRWSGGADAAGLFVDGELAALFDLCREGRKGRWATDADKGRFDPN
jgi:hypothetical protein